MSEQQAGRLSQKCPHDKIPIGAIVEAIAAWPAIVTMAFLVSGPPITCDVPSDAH